MSYFLKCALWTFKVIRLLENCGIPIVFVAFRDKMQKSEGCFVNNRFPYNGGGGWGSFEINISLGLYFYAYVHAKPV